MALGFTEVLLLMLIVAVMFFLARHKLESYFKGGDDLLANGDRETDGPLSEQVSQKEPEGIDVSSGEQPLIVFVSSRMDELWQERQSVHKAIKRLPLTKPWLFEFTPPSTEEVDEAYLSKVEQCDIFILIVGESISAPVLNEFRQAKLHRKPCLVFLKNCQRSENAETFVNDLALKWPTFSSPAELANLVKLALVDELIRGYREGRQKKLSNEHLAVLLLIQEGLRKGLTDIRTHFKTPKLPEKDGLKRDFETASRTDHLILTQNFNGELEIDALSLAKIDALSVATYLESSPLVGEICEIAGRSGFYVSNYSRDDRLRGMARTERGKYVGADASDVSRLVRACQLTGLKTIGGLDATLLSDRRYAGKYLAGFAYLRSGKSVDFKNKNKRAAISAEVLIAMLLIGLHGKSLPTLHVARMLMWPETDIVCMFEASKGVRGPKAP